MYEDIPIEIKCQGYEAKSLDYSPEGDSSVILFASRRKSEEFRCSECGGSVVMNGVTNSSLKDMPIMHGVSLELCFVGHRFRCMKCGKSFNEPVPYKHAGTRITDRAAEWIKALLKCSMSVRAIQKLTGFHWDTIRKVQKEYIAEQLHAYENKLEEENYRPRFLAVDEFAIHKGHTYATAVMDLERGHLIWVGKGRTKADFEKFFEETDPALMSDVMAVAMDMNASYNTLVQKHMPHAQIVYDRFHMLQQYGKEVLGVVRLQEARRHREISFQLKAEDNPNESKEEKVARKAQMKEEKAKYRLLKGARWTLLMNKTHLSKTRSETLEAILSEHNDLAVCYAMKEELTRLYELRDTVAAQEGWIRWFDAALHSGIQPLVHFAELKRKRLDGLVAHASFQIGTGKLEGFNNRIKVAKRIGYGYRDDDYFFSLIRFLSLPASR